jgi:Protein of unknown function (DUF2961)
MRLALPFLVAPLLAGCALDPLPVPLLVTLPLSGPAPTVPVGLDTYRMWDHLPYLRIGVRAYLRSTYDRTGGNEGADASHFLRQEAVDSNVAFDVEGPGVLYFARANNWHGSPWHYRVDGADHVLSESNTAHPEAPSGGSVFLPQDALPAPLALTSSVTQGADLSWVPIPYASSLSIAFERTHYGTGYFIHHQFPDGPENLSQPLAAWDESAPDPAVVAWVAAAGADLAPTGPSVVVAQGTVDVPASGSVVALDLPTPAPLMVRALRLRAPAASAVALSQAHLRVTWDDRADPSIDAPIGLFFGSGSLYNRANVADLVKATMASVHFAGGDVALSFYYPMPFFRHARVEIEGAGEALPGVAWEVVTEPYTDPPGQVAYFHASYVDQGTPALGQDLVMLDTTGVEGGGDWCGHFAGTSFTFSDTGTLTTLEGDPRFFFDDSQTPQGQGTGTEEWGGGGDYWNGGQAETLAFAGHPAGVPSGVAAQGPDDLVESAYRFLVADVMPFGKNARIQIEHGGVDDSVEHYRTVAYWYGRPGACLVPTDALHVGDAADEIAHAYSSPDASPVDTLTSRFELGVDTLNGVETYPPLTDTGRHTTGTTELTLAIAPSNEGVLLRRRLDDGFPDQRAMVSVAGSPFEPAGVWYTAGSNSVVYSDPPGELDPPADTIETSNRRFREDELLVPPRLTRGRSSIRVRLQFAPVPSPLVPGGAVAPLAWSEYRYWAYTYVVPTGAP